MNSAQAKKLDFPKVLSRLGFEPVKITKNGTELWYRSPFRNEKDASFHTSFLSGKWIWNDFGDTGGTVLDFIMRYHNSDVKGALQFLDGLFSNAMPDIQYDAPAFSSDLQEAMLVLDKTQNINLMKAYLTEQRGLDLKIADRFLTEVVFTNKKNGKQFFAAGIKNVSEGYEVRNPFFKGAIGKKDYSFLKGEKNDVVCLFEGLMDLPSCVQYLSKKNADQTAKALLFSPKNKGLLPDVVVLNSASFREPVLAFIKKQNYKFLHGFWDNDRTGLELKTYFGESLGAHKVISWHHLYQPYKDFNAAISAKIPLK